MQEVSVKIYDLFKLMKHGYMEAFLGLYDVKTKKNEDPEQCVYVKRAEAMMHNEGEVTMVINKMEEVINAFKRHSAVQ